MHKGTIKCDCGQDFYYETVRDFINCISCGKQYEVKNTLIDSDQMELLGEGD